MKRINLLLSLILLAQPLAFAREIMKTDNSWDGGPFQYPAGKPEVTSIILSMKEGEVTPWHCHPIPTMGYVLDGNLQVETREGKKTALKKGDPVMEVMKTIHRGHGLEGGVEIVVFYAGVTGMPETILESDTASDEYCLTPQ